MEQLLANKLDIKLYSMLINEELESKKLFFNSTKSDKLTINTKSTVSILKNEHLFIDLKTFIKYYKKEKLNTIKNDSFIQYLIRYKEENKNNQDSFLIENSFKEKKINEKKVVFKLPVYNFMDNNDFFIRICSLYLFIMNNGDIVEYFSIISKDKKNGYIRVLTDEYPLQSSIFEFNNNLIPEFYSYFETKTENKSLLSSVLELKNVVNKIFFDKNCTVFDKLNKSEKKFIKSIYNEFEYLNKHTKREDKYSNINYLLSSHLFLTYEYYLITKNSIDADISLNLNEETIRALLTESNYIKHLQYFVPKANKETFKLLNTILHQKVGKNDKLDLFESTKTFDYYFLNVFENAQNLNKFLSYIDVIYKRKLYISDELSYISKGDSLYEFVENILINFFSSKKRMENIFIKEIKAKKEKINRLIKEQIEIGECYCYESCECFECDCDDDDDDYCDCETDCQCECECGLLVGLNSELSQLDDFYSDLIEIQRIYNSFIELRNELSNNELKNKEKLNLINIILNKKMNSLKEIHDELSLVYSSLIDEKENFKSQGLELLKSDNYYIQEITDSLLLKEVGIRMNHCVSTYKDYISKGHTSIFVVKNTHNLKYELCLEYQVTAKSISQAKGNYNHLVKDKEILQLVRDFCNKNGIKIKTNDLISIKD